MKKALLLITAISTSLAFMPGNSDHCGCPYSISDLREALKTPETITCLDLSMQKLKVLPADVMKFSNLECLDLSFNTFSTLPDSLVKLTKLKYLNLDGTRYMPKLPAVLAKMPSLKRVDVKDHPEWSAATKAAATNLLPGVNVVHEEQVDTEVEIVIPGQTK
ncbi:MAG: leucine-rich repeat domain-containing protein [Flavobacteriales bacterium]